ncbi:Crp/Fnr family transcriptional regulator [Hydrogenoanaerobacterium saccharovorans]|uniref:Crp/Fnr family transcriptional regulator n=1 Tax=Hydrogenoanaerobacterium saccharovorans TaxID=474960 RepID=UPI001FAF9CC3|nr:Crp/Fnr family transcriptional regulator [Hydrogenoanaerobacterium saccharovorans]
MIGESDCILGQPYSSTATVVLPSRVRAVPSALVQELFHADPVFADWLLQYQARKVRLLLGQNMTLSFDRARQRVAKTLLYLCGQYGRQKEDGIWLTNRFTCSDVAGITNVSRVSVNLIFREWEEAGILTRAHGRCCIRDPEELRRLAEPD